MFSFFVIIEQMKKDPATGETLCRNFCAYYKPAKKEELACRGFVVVQRLIEKGRAVPLARPEAAVPPDKRVEESLRQRLCRACDFRENDCDFILTGGNASPCGGFALLVRLLGTGKITIEEIETA
jgi:hypothetical protein